MFKNEITGAPAGDQYDSAELGQASSNTILEHQVYWLSFLQGNHHGFLWDYNIMSSRSYEPGERRVWPFQKAQPHLPKHRDFLSNQFAMGLELDHRPWAATTKDKP